MRRAVAYMTFSREAEEDAAGMREHIAELIRRSELAWRGFLGLIRCERCQRTARCVHVVDGRLYGRHCAREVLG